MEEGIDRQGMHTFWRNYVSKLKKKERKKRGVSMLQAPVVYVSKKAWNLLNIECINIQICN
jgi:hypothetical protein